MPRESEVKYFKQFKDWFRPKAWPRHIKHIFTDNLLQKLVAFVVAILLYLLTTGEKNIVTSLKMGLELVTPEGLISSSAPPSDVLISVQGPRSRINAVLNRTEVLTVQLKGAKPGISFVKINPQMLNLPPGVEVVSIEPSVFETKLEAVVKKEFPVKLLFEGDVAQGYRLIRYELRPPTIEIRGSAANLSKLTEVSTVPMPLDGLQETIEQEVKLALPVGDVTYDKSNQVKAYVEIEPIYRGKVFTAVPVSILSRYKAISFPKTVSVKVRGPEILMKAFNQDQIKVEIDLSNKDPGIYLKEVQVKVPHPLIVQSVSPKNVKVQLK